MADKVETTVVLMERTLVLYRRERSAVWQCRFQVEHKWQRATTKERELEKAKAAAKDLYIKAEIRKHDNQPIITRKFRDIAKLAIKRMEDDKTVGNGKASYADYIIVINNYLIPCLGNRNITSIDNAALDVLDAWRIEKLGKSPAQSTLLTHNAALNRVFKEGVIRGFLTHANIPKLDTKGRTSERRPAFVLEEIHGLLGGFESWIERATTELSKELRLLMRDYVEMLLDTGARPGKELMNLKWKQVKFFMTPSTTATGVMEKGEYGEGEKEVVLFNLNRSVELVVTGKTGTRHIIGRQPTVKALERIAKRNYDITNPVADPFANIATAQNNDFVLRIKAKDGKQPNAPTSFQHLFESYLTEHNLLTDPITAKKRVLYSLRHTYATFALENDKTPATTLVKQMGTSLAMLDKHYSHLNVRRAAAQLSGEETRKLIEAGGSTIDAMYKSTKPVVAKKTAKKKATKKSATNG